jgi:hypothetical protein
VADRIRNGDRRDPSNSARIVVGPVSTPRIVRYHASIAPPILGGDPDSRRIGDEGDPDSRRIGDEGLLQMSAYYLVIRS